MLSRTLSLISIAVALAVHTIPATQALPTTGLRHLDAVPMDADILAADADTGIVYAFNKQGESLGVMANGTASPLSRRAGGCTAMDVKTVKSVRGWQQLSEIADIEFSDGRRDIGTNEQEYPNFPATICIDTKPVDIAVRGKCEPKCSTNTQTVDGEFVGTSGTVELSVTTGTDYTIQTTTTQQTSFGIGVTYSAKFTIPEVVEVGASTTFTAQVANTYGESTTGTSKHQVTTKVVAHHADGKTCKLDLNTKTCTTEGAAQVPFIAKGFVWFKYVDKVRGHYWWALKIDSYASDEDRSLYIDVNSVIGSETKSAYKAVCE